MPLLLGQHFAGCSAPPWLSPAPVALLSCSVVKPPVVGTPELLRDALLQEGAALVRTGEFLMAVPSATSLQQQSITRSSRATTTEEVSMPSLDQIRNPNNTSWVAIINDGKDNSGSRLRKTSLTSEDNWQKAGANWLRGALEPLVLNGSTWSRGDCTGPRIYQAAGLLRLTGVLRQHWHADAALANSLLLQEPDEELDEFDALPLSALHPLSPGGTTILIVPSDTRVPSQAFVPPGHVLIWRGDLEHAGDEFLCTDNLALFTYILPPAALFEMERDIDGATLTFGTGRQHSQLVLPKGLRGCDQRAGDTSPLLGTDAAAENAISDTPTISGDTSQLLGTVAAAENAIADNSALSGTASPHSSPERDAFSAVQLDVYLAGLNAEYGSPPSSPLPTSPTPGSGVHMPLSPLPTSPAPESGVHACGSNLTVGSSIYPCGGNMAESMQSGQMLEQLQMDPLSRGSSFTGAVPDCEQLRPIAESTMDDDASNDMFEAQALNNSNWALEAVSNAALLASPLMETILSDAAFGSLATPELPLQATAKPLGPSVTTPILGPYANAAGLTRSRGSQSTRLTEFANQEQSTQNVPVAYAYTLTEVANQEPSTQNVPVACALNSDDCQHLPLADLPLAEASLQGSDALEAANKMVDQADERMHPRVLSFLRNKRDERVQACMEVLKHNETLVFGRSLSGYSQVRVVGPSMQGSIDSQLDEAVRSGRPLRFQAARVLPPLLPNGRRTTVHGQYYLLPELAASELAKSLTDTLPTPSPAVSNLSVDAQNALQSAEAEGLTLERSAAGFCGVMCNPNAGGGKIRAKPFQARLYVIDSTRSKRARVCRGYFGSAEEAALHYVKLLKYESIKYSATPS